MAYTTYPRKAAILAACPWYSVPRLLAALNALRSVNFAIQAQRDQALQRLGALAEESAPFDRERRFVAGLWVCEAVGDWGRKFMQLRMALSTKDLLKDPGAKEHRGADIGDALSAFHNALNAMTDQLVRLDGVNDQRSFETDYGLVWGQPPA